MDLNQSVLEDDMNPINVSIIIPVYNTELFLPELWESIKKQTYPFIEIIFIDDGSVDNSYKLLQSYATEDNRVKVIHKTNGGRNSAREEGLKCASGEYVAFVDSDDMIDDSYIYSLIEPVQLSEKRWDVIIGGMKTYGLSSIHKHLPEGELSYIDLWENMLSKEVFSWTLCGKLYRKNCISELNNSYINAEDLYSNWKICKSSISYYYIPKDGYIYRLQENNKYVGDIGPIEILMGMGNEFPKIMLSDKEFINTYCIRTFDEIIRFVREVCFCRDDSHLDSIYDNYKKWTQWVADNLIEAMDMLEPFYAYYLKTGPELVLAYSLLVDKLRYERKERLFIYGAGAMAKKVAIWMERLEIPFDGFVVSNNAESKTNIDDVHAIKNVNDVSEGIIIWGMKLNNILDVIDTVDLERFDVVYL